MNLFQLLDESGEYIKELEERLEDATADADEAHRELEELKLSVQEAAKLMQDAHHACATNKTTKAEGLILDAVLTLYREKL